MCERKLLTQREIAERSGLSTTTVHYILNGDREPSKASALALTFATWVAPAAWLYPEHFFNPYIPYESAFIEARMWCERKVDMAKWKAARIKFTAGCEPLPESVSCCCDYFD